MEIDGALFWYLRNFFGDFTHLNCPSLCYNLKLIITNYHTLFFTFLWISCSLLLLLSLAFKIWKEIRLPQKLKHLNIGNKFSLENSQVAINLHSSDVNLGNFDKFWISYTEYHWCQVFGNPERNLSSRISKRVQNARVTRFFKNSNTK